MFGRSFVYFWAEFEFKSSGFELKKKIYDLDLLIEKYLTMFVKKKKEKKKKEKKPFSCAIIIFFVVWEKLLICHIKSIIYFEM